MIIYVFLTSLVIYFHLVLKYNFQIKYQIVYLILRLHYLLQVHETDMKK